MITAETLPAAIYVFAHNVFSKLRGSLLSSPLKTPLKSYISNFGGSTISIPDDCFVAYLSFQSVSPSS